MPRRKADELPDNHGPLWTDISVSDTEPLPKLSKTTTISNPLFLARSHHSHVYTIDITEHNETRRAILKLFPKTTKRLYVREVEAYRFLSHYGVAKEGVVPQIFGILPTISQHRLDVLLRDSIPENAPIAPPASGIVMEFIEGAVPPTRENMTPAIAWDALEGLRLIHKAHILHQDTEARNLLIRPNTGEAVWFDFSSAQINRMILLALQERQHAKQILFRTLMDMDEPTTDHDSDVEAEPKSAARPDVLSPRHFDNNIQTETRTIVPPVFNTLYRLTFHLYIVATSIEGVLFLFLPSETTSLVSNLFAPTLIRSESISSLTLLLLCIGVIRSLTFKVSLQSTLDFSLCFQCATSLSNLTIALASGVTGDIDIFVWIKIIFLVPWLLIFLGNQRRSIVDGIYCR